MMVEIDIDTPLGKVEEFCDETEFFLVSIKGFSRLDVSVVPKLEDYAVAYISEEIETVEDAFALADELDVRFGELFEKGGVVNLCVYSFAASFQEGSFTRDKVECASD